MTEIEGIPISAVEAKIGMPVRVVKEDDPVLRAERVVGCDSPADTSPNWTGEDYEPIKETYHRLAAMEGGVLYVSDQCASLEDALQPVRCLGRSPWQTAYSLWADASRSAREAEKQHVWGDILSLPERAIQALGWFTQEACQEANRPIAALMHAALQRGDRVAFMGRTDATFVLDEDGNLVEPDAKVGGRRAKDRQSVWWVVPTGHVVAWMRRKGFECHPAPNPRQQEAVDRLTSTHYDYGKS